MSSVIKVENLSKAYQLGQIGTGTLSRDLERWWALKRGKEDPFLKIGETNDRASKGNSNVVWSLKDINFEIKQGEAVGIIGRNGAGKSTLLKILSRVTAPTTGKVKVKGRIASLLEVGTGFHPELTGKENIFLNGAILGMRRREIQKKFDEIVAFAAIERYVETPVKRYSSGMYVRLAFAVAAHLDSEILIVDEVLAVGDAEFQKKCLGKMGEVSKGEGRTVLFVSHNMSSILSLCQKGLMLNNGIVQSNGRIENVIHQYFIGQNDFQKLELSSIENRQGTGQLRFTKIRYFNERKQEKNEFLSGECFVITVFFEVEDEFFLSKSSRIDIGINDSFNNRVTWMSTSIFQDTLERNANYVSFVIDELLLNEGVYNVNLYCESDFGIADWIQNASQFEVIGNDVHGTGKCVPSSEGKVITKFKIGGYVN